MGPLKSPKPGGEKTPVLRLLAETELFGTFGVSLVSVGAIGSSVRAVSAPACEQAIIMVYRNANIAWEGDTGRSVFCGLVSGLQECLRDLE